jgi:putative peptidoglycan lipid II flippase
MSVAPSPQPGATSASPEPSAGAERRAIVGRAGIVALGTLASRILGLGREQVLAALFTRNETDAFITAFMIPNLLRQLLAEGAVQTSVLPVLAASRERAGDEATRELFRRLRGLSLLLLAAASLGGVLAAPWLVTAFAGGFRQHPGQFERTVELTRWVFPYIFFMGSAALGLAALNTYQRYVVTAFAPALLNVSFIVCALCLPGALLATGLDRIYALAVGVWLGGVLQVVAQWPSLQRVGMLRAPKLDLQHPGVRDVLKRIGPATLGIGVYYLDVMVGRHLLSELDVGATTYFTFALRLCDFPQGIFIMALQAATLPSLSRIAAKNDWTELGKTFAFGMRLSLFVAVPATLLFVALAEPVVVLIFQRGEFDAAAAAQTARALAAQGAGIWAVAAVRQLVTTFYALGDTRTPAVVAAIDFLVFVALALALRPSLGHVGISWAVTGASLAQMLLLWWRLGRRRPEIETWSVLRSGALTLLCSLPAAAAAAFVARLLTRPGAGEIGRAAPAVAGSALFVAVFLVGARLLKHKELEMAWRALRRRRGG